MNSRHLKVGLQVKAILILTFVIIGVMMIGGWFYYQSSRALLQANDRMYAERLCESLAVSSQYHLRDDNKAALQRLVSDLLQNQSVQYVAILDFEGKVAVTARRDYTSDVWKGILSLPPSISLTQQITSDVLTVSRPIRLREAIAWTRPGIGAVRMVIDTSHTRASLGRVQKRMAVVAAAIVFCFIPLSYMIVWRVLINPVSKLVVLARRLGEGDLSVRTNIRQNDEVGELAAVFDWMAGEVGRTRCELINSNENLGRKVALRTKEIRQANTRLREEMTEKEDFLRAVSHDLNAPLRNIDGMASLIIMNHRGELPEGVVSRLERIQANVEQETALLGELLELSRIRSQPQVKSAVSFRDMLADLAGAFEYDLRANNIELIIDPVMPSLYVEKNRLRQVFQNLIDNAIKYMDRADDGQIEISYAFEDDFHRFCVRDNGPGIDPDQQAKVFQVFQRGENSTVTRIEGKGVGLSLVKSVMNNYDGRAWVESKPGKGASFYVTMDSRKTIPQEMKPPNGSEQEEQLTMHPVG